MMIAAPSLKWEIQRIRRKLQFERLLKGFAIVSVFFIIASIATSYLLAQHNFSDDAIFWSRILAGAALAFLALKLLIIPIFRWPSPKRVARFLEERHPELQERLATAVEIRESPGTVHPVIRQLIERDAAGKLQTCGRPILYHRRSSLTSLLGTALSLLVFLTLFWGGPEAYRYSLGKLLTRADDTTPPLYSITVTPGDAKVVRHADVEIRAVLNGFDSENVKLQAKYETRPAWEEAAMRPAREGNGFVFLFFDARDRIEYFVEADGIRSPQYTITVSEIPAVEKLELTLHFPRHTGLTPEVKEDDGDIRALIGTRAEFSVKTDQPVMGGSIKLEEGGEVVLEAAAPNQLTGSLTVKTDDFYRFRLQNMEGVWSFASDEYVIEALEDQPPTISFTRPGRDQRVTNLEEVFTEVKAEDDYGVRKVELHYSVNGAPNQTIGLDAPRYARSLTAAHTFYLEEFDLQPGDFVSYFAEAADAVSIAATDLYFLEVEPYDREYYQSQQSGGGGGQPDDMMLAKFQKEIIVATFNVLREEKSSTRKEFEENVQTVALMQQQLKQQAATILDRLERRGAVTDTEIFRKMKDHLSQAIVHMGEAHQLLTQFKAREALPEEQLAYQQLLRAEALFKEIQLSMGQGGGEGGNSSAEDLADLVDLELDRTKNQYETLQQNRQNQSDQELDEAARKLKELAQRQQQEVERKKRQASQSSSGGSSSSQELLEEIEEMARQLERLSRQKRDQQLNDISRQLKQAARDLRQSQRSGNPQEAQMRAQRALERLQKARDALNRQRESEMSGSVQQLVQESQRLAQQQQEVVKRIEDLEDKQKKGQVDTNFTRELRDLMNEKAGLQEDLQQFEGDLHRTARRLGSKEADAARKLKQGANDVRDQRIPDKMQEGSELLRRGWTSMARQREESVEEDLRQLAETVREAEQAMGRGNPSDPKERAERALNQMGELVENLESLRQRAENQQGDRQGEQSGRKQGQEQQGQQGEEGQEQSGQQGQGSEQSQDSQQSGQQQGQQGQEGQQGQQGQPSDSPGRGDPQQRRDGEPVEAGGNDTGLPSQTEGQREAERASMAANSGGINPTQVRREWQERVMDAQQIRELLKGFDPRRARDVAELARRMREIDVSRIFNDPEEVARLKAQIIEGFRQLELDLYRNLKKDEEQLRLSHEEEVPPQFRDRVEEYYRALAGAKKKQQ